MGFKKSSLSFFLVTCTSLLEFTVDFVDEIINVYDCFNLYNPEL